MGKNGWRGCGFGGVTAGRGREELAGENDVYCLNRRGLAEGEMAGRER